MSINKMNKIQWQHLLDSQHIFISNETNPFINLAIEQFIFQDSKSFKCFFWRNSPCVVIGRNQNPFIETHLSLINQRQIPLVRRKSGGGTVFHDLGNSNYSMIMPRQAFDRKSTSEILKKSLHALDIPAEINERYDVTVNGLKVSGSAYKLTNKNAYHHGTMLIDSDLNLLKQFLHSPIQGISGAGVTSVRSPVTRLREYSFTIDHLSFYEAVAHQFLTKHETTSDYVVVNEETFSGLPEWNSLLKEVKSWDWIYGQTPRFNHTMEYQHALDSLSITMTVEKARIKEINLNSEFINEFQSQLYAWTRSLIGLPYTQLYDLQSLDMPLDSKEWKEFYLIWNNEFKLF